MSKTLEQQQFETNIKHFYENYVKLCELALIDEDHETVISPLVEEIAKVVGEPMAVQIASTTMNMQVNIMLGTAKIMPDDIFETTFDVGAFDGDKLSKIGKAVAAEAFKNEEEQHDYYGLWWDYIDLYVLENDIVIDTDNTEFSVGDLVVVSQDETGFDLGIITNIEDGSAHYLLSHDVGGGLPLSELKNFRR